MLVMGMQLQAGGIPLLFGRRWVTEGRLFIDAIGGRRFGRIHPPRFLTKLHVMIRSCNSCSYMDIQSAALSNYDRVVYDLLLDHDTL